MSNIIPFNSEITKTQDKNLVLSEKESASMAFGFHLKNIGNGMNEDDIKFIHSLSDCSHIKLTRWMCTVQCMYEAGIKLLEINKIISIKADEYCLRSKELAEEANIDI